MSEKERNFRSIYRKNREKWIFAQAMIAAVIAICILISALVAYQLNKTYYIGYREGGSIDYNVFLKENEFYDSDYLGKDQSYVASLIDKIIADLSYDVEMDTDNVNYKYSYSVTSRLEIIDNLSKAAIYNPEYELVSVNNKTQNSSSRLMINEIVVLDYDQYNDLANKFLATYDLISTTSNIVVTLSVDVLSDCNAFSGSATETYKSELRIPLTTKTVNIKMTSAVPDNETKMIACTRGAGYEVFKTTAIVLGVIELFVLLILAAFIYLTRTEDITYTARVKRILSQYKSYIQKIKNMFDHSGYQRIFVETFDEMLEIRDTIQAPILMYENEEKTCTKFMIPTDSKLLYVYEVKIEGYDEPEAEPATILPPPIVSPNITNVVRPVVKVVLNAPKKKEHEHTFDTVIEEPEIVADEAVDVDVTVEPDELEVTDVDTPEEVLPTEELISAEEAYAEADAFELGDVPSADDVFEEPTLEDEIISDEADHGEADASETEEALSEEEVISDSIPEEEMISDEGDDAVADAPTVEDTETEIASATEDESGAGLEDDNEEDSDLTTMIDGKVVQFRYRKSFLAKLIQSDDRIKDFYVAIKNKLLSYKGIKARTSWSFESCNKGRIQCAKLNIKGKTLFVYLNLDTENYNVSKYHFRNVGDKARFTDVPMLLKVKSDRGLKYALELIDEMMRVLGIPLGKIQDTWYSIPYRSTEDLIAEGLIKVIYPYETVLDDDFKPVAKSDAAVESDLEIESLLASIPSAEEIGENKIEVEAIDVRFGDREHTVQRYDPDGNTVEEGDVVLVPAKDESGENEVVREAEVSRGNYKVDASTLDGPLKKIIGVVSRKAKQIFTAMITPVDDD